MISLLSIVPQLPPVEWVRFKANFLTSAWERGERRADLVSAWRALQRLEQGRLTTLAPEVVTRLENDLLKIGRVSLVRQAGAFLRQRQYPTALDCLSEAAEHCGPKLLVPVADEIVGTMEDHKRSGLRVDHLALAHMVYGMDLDQAGLLKVLDLRLRSLIPILDLLRREQIRYAVIGGLALSLLYPEWFTWDVDILASFNQSQAKKLLKFFRRQPFSVRRVEKLPGGRVPAIIQLTRDGNEFDLMRANNHFKLNELDRAAVYDFEGYPIRVVTPEDQLLAMALEDRPTNRVKIPILLRGNARLDWGYIRRWGTRMGIVEELEAIHPTT